MLENWKKKRRKNVTWARCGVGHIIKKGGWEPNPSRWELYKCFTQRGKGMGGRLGPNNWGICRHSLLRLHLYLPTLISLAWPSSQSQWIISLLPFPTCLLIGSSILHHCLWFQSFPNIKSSFVLMFIWFLC